MAGRHGKLSGSPFHIITRRDLAREQYGDNYTASNPCCKYRSQSGMCLLPQNKLRYNKRCIISACKYLLKHKKKSRNNCALLINGKCYYKKLQNCTKAEDLAYCCDHYISKVENPSLHTKLNNKHKLQYFTEQLYNKIDSLNKKQLRIIKLIKSEKHLNEPHQKLIAVLEKYALSNTKDRTSFLYLFLSKENRDKTFSLQMLNDILCLIESFSNVLFNYRTLLASTNIDCSSFLQTCHKFKKICADYENFLKETRAI